MLRMVEIEHEAQPTPFDVALEESRDWANGNGGQQRPTCGGGGPAGGPGGRRVSFQNMTNKPMATLGGAGAAGGGVGRNRSPPPVVRPGGGGVSSGEDEDDDDERDDGGEDDTDSDDMAEEDEDSEDGGLGLQRFGSAAGRPPRLVDDSSDSEDEDVREPVSPTEGELRRITGGEASEELKGLYHDLRGCPCHGHDGDAPGVEKVWELPRKEGGKRVAVVKFTEGSEV